MIFQRIVRCIGRNGENYLARTRRDYFRTLKAGSGAGLITAATVVFKLVVALLSLSLATEAVFCGLNYAVSFLLMQALGFRLATKQPSLLAATLIRRWKSRPTHLQIKAVMRSQFAATVGNFTFVVLAMIGFYFIGSARPGSSFMSQEAAIKTVASLDPFSSGTVFYGTITGIVLWLSSLIAGWTGHLTRKIGFMRRIAGITFNLSLAFFLSVIPFLGKTFELPLDVRHFTLSSGALALSVCTLGFSNAFKAGLLNASIGIVLIGGLNFFVSFLLSFVTSLFAHGLSWKRVAPGLRSALTSFGKTPLEFFIPVRPSLTSIMPATGRSAALQS